MDALFREFQIFWRRHGDLWEAKADYTEAFPHLLVMAFLQRVINGGGRVEREFAAGRATPREARLTWDASTDAAGRPVTVVGA